MFVVSLKKKKIVNTKKNLILNILFFLQTRKRSCLQIFSCRIYKNLINLSLRTSKLFILEMGTLSFPTVSFLALTL